MKSGIFASRGFAAVVAASVSASILAFLIVLVLGQLSPPRRDEDWVEMIPVVAAVVLLWAPAFAAIPAGILGLLVERPMARSAIKRGGGGGMVPFVLASLAAGALLSFVPTLVQHLIDPDRRLFDPFTLGIFSLIGLCSGVSWWLMVVEPGRRGQ